MKTITTQQPVALVKLPDMESSSRNADRLNSDNSTLDSSRANEKRSPKTGNDKKPRKRRPDRLREQRTMTFEECLEIGCATSSSSAKQSQNTGKTSPAHCYRKKNLEHSKRQQEQSEQQQQQEKQQQSEAQQQQTVGPSTSCSNIGSPQGDAVSKTFAQTASINVPKKKEEVKVTANYQIKSIRKGLPNMATAESMSRNFQNATRDLELSKLCVCKRGSSEPKGALAWTFSTFVVIICVVCPLISFTADVTFYLICSEHYEDIEASLNQVVNGGLPSAFVFDAESTTTHKIDRHASDAEKSSQDQSKLLHSPANNHAAPLIKRRLRRQDTRNVEGSWRSGTSPQHVVRHGEARSHGLSSDLQDQLPENQTTAYRAVLPTEISDLGQLQNIDNLSSPICENISTILRYMKTPVARKQIEAHHRVTAEIFEPVFIIGSFPSLLLSIFTRLVVAVTWHDHFISAYVINMAVMPLQLATGALSMHSASYHIGKLGFDCWSCAANLDCSDINFASWISDAVNICLIVVLATKVFDGGAGGCVIFVVLARKLWRKSGHVMLWWYVSRAILSVISFIFCVSISAILIITPAVAVFRLQLVEKMTASTGNEDATFISTVLLIVGLTAWSASVSTLFVYLAYRTYIYCRLKEHSTDHLDC